MRAAFAAPDATGEVLDAVQNLMKRTQIYLSDAQLRDLTRMARVDGTSVAALVRRAVDTTFRTARPAAVDAWDTLAGVRGGRDIVSDGAKHVRRLRRDDRIERIAAAR